MAETSTQTETLAEEVARYATSLEDIAERWGHADDAHTRQVSRRLRAMLRKHDDNTEAAQWLVNVVGYPFNLNFTPRAPEPLWQAIIDVVQRDADGSLHGNTLSRDEVADWLVDP